MQDTSNTLTRWVVSLRAFDFPAAQTLGNLNGTFEIRSLIFALEQQESRYSLNALAPIRRNIPDIPALHENIGDGVRGNYVLSIIDH